MTNQIEQSLADRVRAVFGLQAQAERAQKDLCLGNELARYRIDWRKLRTLDGFQPADLALFEAVFALQGALAQHEKARPAVGASGEESRRFYDARDTILRAHAREYRAVRAELDAAIGSGALRSTLSDGKRWISRADFNSWAVARARGAWLNTREAVAPLAPVITTSELATAPPLHATPVPTDSSFDSKLIRTDKAIEEEKITSMKRIAAAVTSEAKAIDAKALHASERELQRWLEKRDAEGRTRAEKLGVEIVRRGKANAMSPEHVRIVAGLWAEERRA